MKPRTDRRSILMAAGAAALAATTGKVMAENPKIHGTVNYEGGAEIPKGELSIFIENTAAPQMSRKAGLNVKSDGGDQMLQFTLPAAVDPADPALQIVAELTRADGWLLARGSAGYQTNAPVQLTLYTVMY